MAANNFYGFTTGGTINQYGYGTSGAMYGQQQSSQSAFVAATQQPATQYGAYGNRLQQTYEDPGSSYYTAQAVSAVGYGPSAAGFGATATAKSSYYQATTASSVDQTSAYYSQATGKSGPSSNVKASEWRSLSSGASDKKSNWQQSTSSASSSYAGYTESAAAATTSSQSLSGLDKALFTIAANYCQSQNAAAAAAAGRTNAHGARAMWWNKKGKMPTDPSQWKYCELCKMTCPGPQAYKLHLEGKIHKKKEAAVATKEAIGPKPPGQKSTCAGRVAFCSICDTYCSSADAYTAHIRGIKHQKVVKLLMRLGKPLPADAAATAAAAAAGNTLSSVGNTTGRPVTAAKPSSSTSAPVKVCCAPRINFVGGTQLKTTGVKVEEVAVSPTQKYTTSVGSATAAVAMDATVADDDGEDGSSDANIQPIGLEYIEEGMNDAGTAPSFYCKLCDCHFTDIMGKLMHSKGRRHRLAYKKKVDPSLKVDMKVYDRRAQLERMRRRINEEPWRKRELQSTYKMEAEELRYEKEVLEWKLQEVIGGRYVGPVTAPVKHWAVQQAKASALSCLPSDVFESIGRCIQTKHKAIYPTETELKSVQTLVGVCEKSLKLLSDLFAQRDAKKASETTADVMPLVGGVRRLKGVMRVGLLSKGLLLQGSLGLQMVVLCQDKPTHSLVKEIAELLPAQLVLCATDETENYKVITDGNDLLVSCVSTDNPISCTISLTSPAVKVEPTPTDQADTVVKTEPVCAEDCLDEQKCVLLLAELRHAKWFQAKVSPMQSSLVVIRLLMDLCNRELAWSPLSQWALELLVEKCSGGTTATQLSPAKLFLRVFECLASGIILPGGPGIYDVCEKELTDAVGGLTDQEREDLTASAQLMLRQVSLGLVHKVLAIETLSVAGVNNEASQCKRPRISSA